MALAGTAALAGAKTYLRRMAGKLVEMAAAGIGTAVTGYLVAYVSGHFSLFSAAEVKPVSPAPQVVSSTEKGSTTKPRNTASIEATVRAALASHDTAKRDSASQGTVNQGSASQGSASHDSTSQVADNSSASRDIAPHDEANQVAASQETANPQAPNHDTASVSESTPAATAQPETVASINVPATSPSAAQTPDAAVAPPLDAAEIRTRPIAAAADPLPPEGWPLEPVPTSGSGRLRTESGYRMLPPQPPPANVNILAALKHFF